MVSRIPLTGTQLATINVRPDIYRKAGAQLMGKELLGGEAQLKAVRQALEEWMQSSGEITLEMELRPIVERIDEALK